MRRIRTPPVSAEISSPVDLFLIYPVELAVQELIGPAGRQLPFLALVVETDDIQVVAPDERGLSSVRAERELFLVVRIERQPQRALAAESVVIEIVANRDEHRGARRIHFEPAV